MLDINRKAPRFHFSFQISSNMIKGQGDNISLKGVGFYTENEIVPAYEIPFNLVLTSDDGHEYLINGTGSILFCSRKQNRDDYYCGIEFLALEDISKETLFVVIQELIRANKDMKRGMKDKPLDYFMLYPSENVLNKASLFNEMKSELIDKRYYSLLLEKEKDTGDRIVLSTNNGASKEFLNFGSNDFLCISFETAKSGCEYTEKYGAISRGTIMHSNHHAVKREAEAALSDFFGVEKVVLASSGYSACSSAVEGLSRPGDVVILNQSVSQGFRDGAHLSLSQYQYFKNFDVDSLNRIIKRVTPSAYGKIAIINTYDSLRGIKAPINNLIPLIKEADATLILDISSTLCFEKLPEHNLITAGLDEVLGVSSGFFGGSYEAIEYIRYHSAVHKADSPPSVFSCGALLRAIEILKSDLTLIEELKEKQRFFVDGLKHNGLPVSGDGMPVMTLLCKDEKTACDISQRIYEQGIFHHLLVYPYVPMGGSLLRFTVNIRHTTNDIQKAVDIITSAFDNTQG